MKMRPNLFSNTLLQGLLLSVGLSLAIACRFAGAATELADIPLTYATSTAVLPNIALVYDESGTMNYENMPDGGDSNRGKYCFGWYKYNSMAYNPAVTYKAPMKADGTRFADAVFTAALRDGYFLASEKQYDGETDNGTVNLKTQGSFMPPAAHLTFEDLSGSYYSASSLKVTLLNGTTVELMQTDVSMTKSTDGLATGIRNSINANTATTGFSANYNSKTNELTIIAPESQVGLTSTPVLTRQKKSGAGRSVSISAFGSFYYATTSSTSTACELNSAYTPVTSSSDIAAPGVAKGSAAALTNYANWYSYYRRRAFLMKASAGEAFAGLEDGKFRVGLFSIGSIESGGGTANHDLPIATFAGTQRGTWYSRLYGARYSGSTPLRAALSRMGRMYAGKIPGWDPVQYSCQRNYTILSTDGDWNTTDESSSYGPYQVDGSTEVGDQDGADGVTKPSRDGLKAASTLADVAYYYYHTDLRPGSCSNPDVCTDNVPPSGTNADVDDVASYQHMTTFTVGLGVNGTLTYQNGYKTASSGDYYDIKQGTKNWPNPVDGTADTADRIDDLWHAAVNGRGTYYSATDPATLTDGLVSTLNSIKSDSGIGAAAATGNLQPTSGDNAIYIATYRTAQWDGEVSAYTVNLENGAISSSPTWTAAALLGAKIGSTGNTDTRTIYTSDGKNRTLFTSGSGGLTNTQLAYFDNTKLSQYADWNSTQKSTATAALLVNYLRGQDRYEDQDRSTSYGSYERLYRDRSQVLGDVVHSQPVYVKAPPHDFEDSGYLAFKSANQNRAATVYVAANDGMLHAFDAATGEERWAYVPPAAMPEMWRLADSNYRNNHRFFLDGPLSVSDAKIGGAWKTVLIGAMGKGGRAYYALDITDPANPQPLWEFTASDNSNLGYTYGTPLITKLDDGSGTWVAVLTSGYNNIPEGSSYTGADGKGYVFVLNLATGKLIRAISTGVGSVSSPAGLARVNVYVADYERDNTAVAVYGGDLYGNMWRFDPVAGTAAKVASFGSDKPVTAAPEIGQLEGKTLIFFGTGRYLSQNDLSNNSTQAIYGILDDGSTTVTSTNQLVQQTVTTSGDVRNISTKSVDWSTKFGWFVNLPDGGERVVIEPQLYSGTLIVVSIVPTASACQPGGYSWLYQIDYKTGGNITSTTPAATPSSSFAIAGFTIAKVGDQVTGKVVGYSVPSNGGMPSPTPLRSGSLTSSEAKRLLWRVLSD